MRHPFRFALFLAVGPLAAAATLGAAETISASSPLLPAASGTSAAPTTSGSGEWELVGMTVQPDGGIVVAIRDDDLRQSRWLKTGERFGDLQLLSTDANHNRVEVEIGGHRQTLTLRAARVARAPSVAVSPAPGGTSPSAAVMAAASQFDAANSANGGSGGSADGDASGAPNDGMTPADPGNFASPASSAAASSGATADDSNLTPQEKEREARMLLSDLLEISMIQRKAYEEKKAAEGNASAGGTTNANP